VNHTLLVSIVHGQTEGREDMHQLGGGGEFSHMGGPAQIVRESRPLDIVHDHIGKGLWRFGWAGNMEIVDLDNVGMMKRGNQLRFTFEAGNKTGVIVQIGMEYLDGNVAAQFGIEGLPDLRHPTSSQALLQLVFFDATRTYTHSRLRNTITNARLKYIKYINGLFDAF